MKVLFIDDELFRFNALIKKNILPKDAVYAGDAITGMKLLEFSGPFDIVFLDHDLNTIEHGPYPVEITGYDVARFMTSLDWKPKQVVVHSMNPVGAQNIMNILLDNNFNATRVPIFQMISYADFPDLDGLDIEGNPIQRLRDE